MFAAKPEITALRPAATRDEKVTTGQRPAMTFRSVSFRTPHSESRKQPRQPVREIPATASLHPPASGAGNPCYRFTPLGQQSVRNGPAGRPAPLQRLQTGLFAHA